MGLRWGWTGTVKSRVAEQNRILQWRRGGRVEELFPGPSSGCPGRRITPEKMAKGLQLCRSRARSADVTNDLRFLPPGLLPSAFPSGAANRPRPPPPARLRGRYLTWPWGDFPAGSCGVTSGLTLHKSPKEQGTDPAAKRLSPHGAGHVGGRSALTTSQRPHRTCGAPGQLICCSPSLGSSP